jgi:hypothetical protein
VSSYLPFAVISEPAGDSTCLEITRAQAQKKTPVEISTGVS